MPKILPDDILALIPYKGRKFLSHLGSNQHASRCTILKKYVLNRVTTEPGNVDFNKWISIRGHLLIT